MSFLFDNLHDLLRLVVLLLCILSLLGLLVRYYRSPDPQWNLKTRDYWFALVTWHCAGIAATLESLYNNEDFSPRLAITAVAALVCLNGLRRRGAWGNRELDLKDQ